MSSLSEGFASVALFKFYLASTLMSVGGLKIEKTFCFRMDGSSRGRLLRSPSKRWQSFQIWLIEQSDSGTPYMIFSHHLYG